MIVAADELYEGLDPLEKAFSTVSLAGFATELTMAGAVRAVPGMMGVTEKATRVALKKASYSQLKGWQKAVRAGVPYKKFAPAAAKRALAFTKGARAVFGVARFLGWGLLVAELGYAAGKGLAKMASAIGRSELLGTIPQYTDTQRAYTDRQRAIQAIHSSGSTARSVIGKEASYMHL